MTTGPGTTTAGTTAPEPGPSRIRRRPASRSRRLPAASPLTTSTVLELQAARSYPSASVLLTIEKPGPTVDRTDAARFDALVDEACRRLRAECLAEADLVADVLHRFRGHLSGPVDQTVAVFASPDRTARVDLPLPVADRTVVDPTFATRDLVRALHRTPRHVVLLLSANEARLLDGVGGALAAAPGRFPLTDPDHRPGEPARKRFLVDVDYALGAYRRLHPTPLVIAAAQPTLSTFLGLSRNTARLAGTITGNHLSTPPAELQARLRSVLERYLLSRQTEALALLGERRQRGRAVYGLQRAWTAARWERPEMLAVEQGYFYPARLEPDSDTLVPADDPHAPDVCDDVVDELIETVITRGGWIALLDDGTLGREDRVALTLRTR